MNVEIVEIGAEAALFPGKEYISGILVAVHKKRKYISRYALFAGYSSHSIPKFIGKLCFCI